MDLKMKKSLSKIRPTLNKHYENETDYVYSQIKIALFNYYYLIRADLKNRWKTLSKQDQRDAITSLRYLVQMINNPGLYFSRAATEHMWCERATNYAQEKELKNIVDAFYIVESPKDIVMRNIKDAVFSKDMYSKLYTFITSVQNWEYDRTSKNKYYLSYSSMFADAIVEIAQRTQKHVDVLESNPFVRPVKQFIYNYQH